MQTPKKIAVTGAPGRLGRPLVELLEADGHDVVAISRTHGVDVITGEGLADALAGVEIVIDAATGPSPNEDAATEFFLTSARNLQSEGARAGVQRIVLVSIVGIDAFEGGYNAAKRAQEQAHIDGPIPVSILRATQFHEFVEQLMQWGTQGDVAYVWRMRTQLISARSVAEALVELALAPDVENGAISEIAGPREEQLVDAAARLATHRGAGLRVEAVPAPDPLYEAGAALPGAEATLAGPTFEDWLRAA